jgi:signal transduction histidine kinase
MRARYEECAISRAAVIAARPRLKKVGRSNRDRDPDGAPREARAAFCEWDAELELRQEEVADLRRELEEANQHLLMLRAELEDAQQAGVRRQAAAELGVARVAQEVMAARDRIAHDLHDGVIKGIFAVGMQLQATAAMTQDRPVHERLEEAVAQLDVVIQDLRRCIFGIRLEPGRNPTLGALGSRRRDR